VRREGSFRRGLGIALALACAAALGSLPAAAKPPFKHKKRGRPTHEVSYEGSKGGPPPWAPAHGYRRKQANGARVYVPPFGIDTRTCNRELLGAALGGAAGGLLGSEIAKGDDRPLAIAGGTILGILVGGSIGHSMDALDQSCVGQILEYAPAREPVVWKNPDRDAAYEVTAVRTYEDGDDRYCREYQATATIGGRLQETYGTACRQPDGSWQIVH
jgi:surface antigen